MSTSAPSSPPLHAAEPASATLPTLATTATQPSLPGPPSLPATALWSDSDDAARAGAGAFAGLVATPAELGAPTIGHIGRYALKYQVGTGGLGTVYAAHDPLLSRLIAVKTLNVEIREGERESFNAIFINEARAAGGLSHPHIVTVFDAGVSDDRAYIAMELLKGKDLRQLLHEGWRATPAQAVLIVRRVADALAYAHSKGVIHRDIKPANIFMVGRTQPRVLDFGIARVTHRHERDANAGAGSPYYMAPEQVKREPTDRRADVFSLGVVLYELLTAKKPFTGDSLKSIGEAVTRHDPPPVHKVDAAIPADLGKIVARAMEKDPEQRFRSARSFARELRQWLDAHPGGIDPEQVVAAPAPTPRRSRVLALGAAGVLLAAAAGAAAVATWQAMRPEAAPVAVRAVEPRPAAPVPPATTVPPAEAVAPAAPVVAAAPAASEAAAPGPLAVEPAVVTAAAVVEAPPARVAPPVAAPTTAATPKETPRERRLREAREREAREREARPVAAAAPSTGKVRLAISPWGLVEVDGAPSGAAPPLGELVLAEGRHQIVVRNGDFPPYSTTVEVVAGQATTLRYKFP